MGKKPFSAKAKREQLRQKRQAHNASVTTSIAPSPQAAPTSSNNPSANAPSPSSSVHPSSRRSRSSKTSPSQRYRLVFAADTDAARKRQRALAHCPVDLPDDNSPEAIRNRTMSVSDVRPFPNPAFDMPTRPPWSYKDTVNVVDKRELASFHEWMDRVARPNDPHAAYFEGNLETWRQLWRVIERSDVLVLVADIRFPALHFVPGLYHYVTNQLGKGMVLALNKCDLVPADVLLAWKHYFQTHYPSMSIAMFSSFPDAKLAPSKDNSELLSKRERRMARSKLAAWGADQLLAAVAALDLDPRKKAFLEQWRSKLDHAAVLTSDDEDGADINFLENSLRHSSDLVAPTQSGSRPLPDVHILENKLLPTRTSESNAPKPKTQKRRRRRAKPTAEHGFHQIASAGSLNPKTTRNAKEGTLGKKASKDVGNTEADPRCANAFGVCNGESETESNLSEVRLEMDEEIVQENMITIGVVGHPNAGKSSMINGVFRKKVVSTSRTPGHTKHLQTIFLSDSVRLCDCPGLVFPGLASRELQILAGMYPISQVREPYAAVKYLADRVPLVRILNLDSEIERLEAALEEPEYIMSTGWTAWKICEAWAIKRGFRTAKAARLDVFRAANHILRLALDGRIVLATLPEGYSPDLEHPVCSAHEVMWDVNDDADASVVSGSGKVAAVLSGTYDEDDRNANVGEDDVDEAASCDDLVDTKPTRDGYDTGKRQLSENLFSMLADAY